MSMLGTFDVVMKEIVKLLSKRLISPVSVTLYATYMVTVVMILLSLAVIKKTVS